jgi:hypothetical protein
MVLSLKGRLALKQDDFVARNGKVGHGEVRFGLEPYG